MSEEHKRELFIFKEKAKGLKLIDQNYLNNGGHDEFIIFKLDGYKSRPPKYCVIEYDIYGKIISNILTKEELVNEFGEEINNKLDSF